ncbi:hypothetical protein OKW50_005652 [Paraburkholderia youngii]
MKIIKLHAGKHSAYMRELYGIITNILVGAAHAACCRDDAIASAVANQRDVVKRGE